VAESSPPHWRPLAPPRNARMQAHREPVMNQADTYAWVPCVQCSEPVLPVQLVGACGDRTPMRRAPGMRGHPGRQEVGALPAARHPARLACAPRSLCMPLATARTSQPACGCPDAMKRLRRKAFCFGVWSSVWWSTTLCGGARRRPAAPPSMSVSVSLIDSGAVC